jgi:hypothetical protein
MLHEAFGEHSASRRAVFEWHVSRPVKCHLKMTKHSGQPSTCKMIENVEKIQKLVQEEHHRTIHELASTTGISYVVCQEILTDNLNITHTAPSSQSAHPYISENHRVCD